MPPYTKLSTLFIALFLTTGLAGQSVEKIGQLLKDKNFVPFNNYISKYRKGNVDYYWEMLRTVVGDYREGIVEIKEDAPLNDGTGGYMLNNYRIYLLSTKNRIFYYKFIYTIYDNKGPDNWGLKGESIDSLRDDVEYLSFENSFKQTYGDTLNHSDLFLTSIVYGSHCGITGTNPEYRERLNLLLQDGGIDVIRHWLKSANAEKQLYALMGYRILKNQGYTLTEDEKRIISVVEQKKGTVYTCSGCIYMDEPFEGIVSQINSIPTEYLRPEKPRPSILDFKTEKSRSAKILSYWWILSFGVAVVLSVIYILRRIKKGDGPTVRP
ncbi:MAG TPA: hypothetical protein VK666_27795 [Chryseolinea sp.]|nr:hypothetical protein [Chryseolinea sp.]